MRVSALVATTAAFLCCASTPVSAADYTGFWKYACTDPVGISIKPDVDKKYSIRFCDSQGCVPWKPNTTIDGDPLYRAIDAGTLDYRIGEGAAWRRYTRCSAQASPLDIATVPAQAQASPQAQPQPTPPATPTAQAQPSTSPPAPAKPRSGGGPLNPAWFGTWKSEDGTSTVTISKTQMIRDYKIKNLDGSVGNLYHEFDWSPSTDPDPEHFGYSAERISPDRIAERYEQAARDAKADPTEWFVTDPATARRAIAAISPGVYRVLWSYLGGDCMGWDFIVDGDRMLEVQECKYLYAVMLYNRVRTR